MMKTLDWLKTIMSALEDFTSPKIGFVLYKKQNMNQYYTNFFDCSYSYLFYECFLEDIEEIKNQFEIPDSLFKKLNKLRNVLLKKYDMLSMMDDFKLLEDPIWNEITFLAKECYEGLKEMEKEEKDKKG